MSPAMPRAYSKFLIMGSLASLACGQKQKPAGETTGVTTASNVVVDKRTSDLHARLVADANDNYTLGNPIDAVDVPKGSIDPSNPERDAVVVAKTMTRNSQPEIYQFVADFNSDRRVKKLGLGKGDNFIWRVPIPGDTFYVMVPSDLKVDMSFLDYDKHGAFVHGAHKPPQVVKVVVASGTPATKFEDLVFGGCVEGSQCPSGHCAISGATNRFTFSDYQTRAKSTPP